MSTVKFLAKKVQLDWRNHKKPRDGVWHWFETQDGRRFEYVNFGVEDYLDVKVYKLKKLNVHHSQQWAYEIYEVPRKNLTYKIGTFKTWKHWYQVYEVKK